MRSPIQVYKDWQFKKAIKEQLLETLRKVPPGQGVEVPKGELQAVAVQELVREQAGKVIFTRWRDTFMLCRRAEYEHYIAADLKAVMETTSTIIHPDEDLTRE